MKTTHPMLDPELAAVLAAVHEHLSPSITPGDIEALRASPMFAVADEDLRRNGAVDLRNLSVPVRRLSRYFAAGPETRGPGGGGTRLLPHPRRRHDHW